MRQFLLAGLMALALVAQGDETLDPVRVGGSLAGSLAPAVRDPADVWLEVGEGSGSFPNWNERILHQWINRARVDPAADLASCSSCPDKGCYSAAPPLSWNEALNRAARFHANEMVRQSYFAHDSRCSVVPNIANLYPVACDGASSCACVGGSATCVQGCTSWPQRVGMFGERPSGEIIASGDEPNQIFYLWLHERATAATCQASSQNIHRWIIFQSSGGVGLGVDRYSVGDFGGGAAPAKIPSGSHYPRQAAAVELWANWYDAAPPRSASVVVDGVCIPMALRRGNQTNGAWMASAPNVGSGCHRYYFSFVDSAGSVVTYPTSGSLGIGQAASCPDWAATRSQASCDSQPPVTPRLRPVRRRR